MNEFYRKRILITGGTGFFGEWLVERLLRVEAELVVLSRKPASYALLPKNAKISVLQGDVRDFTFPGGSFDYVIHAATCVSVTPDSSDEVYSVIVDGTRRVLEFARQARVRRFLYVSSGAVYGVQPPVLSNIPETFPCNPVTVYGAGKRDAEAMCRRSTVETVIARPFAFVGPYLPLDAHFAIGNFIGSCLRNEPIVIKGDGTPVRSYMYGSDLAEWLLTMLLKGRAGSAYNVGSSVAISIAEVARLVRSVAGTANEIRICQQALADSLPERYVPCITKASEELGLALRVSLQDAIGRTLSWCQANRVHAYD